MVSVPGFTAEVAARAPASVYGTFAAGDGGGGATAGVVAAATGFHFPTIKCCRRAPLLGNRFVCTQRAKLPWETCTCVATMTGPVFICKDNGFGSFEPA
jgi:hypothetical protein